MQVISRLGLACGTLAASLFLAGCQGLVAVPPTNNPGAQPSKVSVTLAGSGSGAVSSTPAGINCGTTCTANFADGAVTLTATPGASFVFTGWSGACSGTSVCTIPAGSTVTATATFTATLQSINHIVVLLQENRSFDHYFGKMNEYRQANSYPTVVDAAPPAVDEPPANASNPTFDRTGTVTPFHMTSMCIENPSPFWDDGHIDFNLDNPTSTTALNNGFVWDAANMATNSGEVDTAGRRVMGYYDSNDLPFYYFMASNFAMSDQWFAPVLSRTQPNRMYMMAATSDGHVFPFPLGGTKSSRKTIFELLQDAGITWKVYVPAGSPTLVEATEMTMFTYGDAHPENFVYASSFAGDAANGTLPQVAYIAEGQGTDEHPAEPGMPGGSVQFGSSYVADNYLLPLLSSRSWKDSVFILAWDEGGGFYDHVPPHKTVAPDNIAPSDLGSSNICFGVAPSSSNTCGFDHTGYRVPMMLISPFARKNFVSHTPADHTAILKFIETRFGLGNLTERDKAQIDMTEFFDFVNGPWLTPPTPPTQPSPGPCYLTSLP